jgi:hypothetical protein
MSDVDTMFSDKTDAVINDRSGRGWTWVSLASEGSASQRAC